MLRSLIRTLSGPSRDPRMVYISRPLPRELVDEAVLAALEIALATDPDPRGLVETLPGPLKQVTGHDYEVLDRSARDVTGAFTKTQVMIRAGDVGHWPGYDVMAYPLLVPPERVAETLAAIIAADADGPTPPPSGPKPGWEPPPPRDRPARGKR